MKPASSRTLGQLHFEDLDPHRFEDLVRQLAYGFRTWDALEAIGRSGDDGGIDIRGIEGARAVGESEAVDEQSYEDRVWFIQVKREQRLGPKRATDIAEQVVFDPNGPPDGFILAAPANISRRARDTLRKALAERGVRQVIVWGLGELEDQLFDPVNDHLLFAYFGISLRVRQRSMVAELRQRLAKKRQIFQALGDLGHSGTTPVLLRDPTAKGYSTLQPEDDGYSPMPPWFWTGFKEHANPEHVLLIYARHHAWVSADGTSYDVREDCSHVVPFRSGFDFRPDCNEEECDRLWRYFHNAIPEAERAWVVHVGLLPYDEILLVDDLGDAAHGPPHLLVTRDHPHGFFERVRTFVEREAVTGTRARQSPGEDPWKPIEEFQRAILFPDPVPDVPWGERSW